MNEEEIKVKIVLPYLERLGCTASELQLETSFFIRVGRHALDVNHGSLAKRGGVGARLDILVKRNENNLFIVETKEEQQELTDSDRDQAISYARLVHPVAPFALVTNGRAWKMFDSISKSEIRPGDFTIRNNYTIALPEAAINEAVETFLGYSLENVRRFCTAQVSSSLKPLLGSKSDLTKKYIPELHVPDEALKGELQRFLTGDVPGFLIVAESGMGKTCELCYHACDLLHCGQDAVLFLQGHLIETSVTHALAEEFNWTFSEQLGPVELLRRLERTLNNRSVIVFIDAIDEWTYPQRLPSLYNLLKNAKDHRIKVVFTCKSASWTAFSQYQGTSTGIQELLHKITINGNQASEYALRGFSSQTLAQAVDKYSAAFGIRPQFEVAVLNEAQRNPFLLRVFYTVAKASGLLECTFSSAEFFRTYYRLLMEKTGLREIAEAQVLALARVIWETNEDTVELDSARAKLGLGLNEAVLPALFEFSILTKSSETAARVGFYFQQLRDFVISFLVLKWPELDQKRFASEVQPLKRDGVQADVLTFYYRHASETQKRIVDGPLFANAKKYLDLYQELIERHFSALRLRFTPHTPDRVGFIAELLVPSRSLGFHGFRRIKQGEADVLFIPVAGMFTGSNLLDLSGGVGPFISATSFGSANLDLRMEVIENECERQLKGIVDKEWLNEETAADLMMEKLAAIVLSQPHHFQELLREPNRPFPGIAQRIWVRELSFPFHWTEARRVLLRRILMDQFEMELLRRKAIDQKGPEIPGIPGPVITAEEVSVIERRADAFLASGAGVQISNFRLEATALEVVDISTALTRIGAPPEWSWEDRGELYNALRDDPHRGMDRLKEYLVKLFTAFLEGYKCVIDYNFPTLRSYFRLRSQMPVSAFTWLGASIVEEVRTGRFSSGAVMVLYCRPRAPQDGNSVTAIAANELVGTFPNCKIRGQDYECYHVGKSSLHPLTFSSLAQRGLGQLQEDLPVRKLVYEQIKRELPDALKEFRLWGV